MKTRQSLTATVYDRKGNVLAIGRNSYEKSHPHQARIAQKVGLPEKIFLHAEVSAILKAMRRGKPHKIHVERYSSTGEPLLAEPCPVCKQAIKEAGIQVISYTI